jgi:hypothetical protein
MPDSPKTSNIVEVTYNLPAEVFIARHVGALRTAGAAVTLVARHQLATYSASASVGGWGSDCPGVVLPNFDHMSWPAKFWNLRHLFAPSCSLSLERPIREQVLAVSAPSRKRGEFADLKMSVFFREHLLQSLHYEHLLRSCCQTGSRFYAWPGAFSNRRFCYIFASPLTGGVLPAFEAPPDSLSHGHFGR